MLKTLTRGRKDFRISFVANRRRRSNGGLCWASSLFLWSMKDKDDDSGKLGSSWESLVALGWYWYVFMLVWRNNWGETLHVLGGCLLVSFIRNGDLIRSQSLKAFSNFFTIHCFLLRMFKVFLISFKSNSINLVSFSHLMWKEHNWINL